MNVLNESPHIAVIENFATDNEIIALLEAARTKLRVAMVSGAKERSELHPARRAMLQWVNNDLPETVGLATRICETVNMPFEKAESFQVVRYKPGEEYRDHHDAWIAGTDRGDLAMKSGGQRVLTTILYLNKVQKGGHTAFPKLNINVEPKRGSLLIFDTVERGTLLQHPLALHAGRPVIQGEKWIATLWFREPIPTGETNA